MPNVLNDQLHAYAESWREAHREAINCRELEELIRLAMFLYDWIRRREEQWAEAVREDRKAFSLGDANRIAHLYQLWLKPADEMRRLIRDMRKAGFDVQGARAYRRASVDAELRLAITPERAQAAEAELAAGGGRSLEDVMHELRDRAVE